MVVRGMKNTLIGAFICFLSGAAVAALLSLHPDERGIQAREERRKGGEEGGREGEDCPPCCRLQRVAR